MDSTGIVMIEETESGQVKWRTGLLRCVAIQSADSDVHAWLTGGAAAASAPVADMRMAVQRCDRIELSALQWSSALRGHGLDEHEAATFSQSHFEQS